MLSVLRAKFGHLPVLPPALSPPFRWPAAAPVEAEPGNRFRALTGEAGWAELPEAVQRRFSKSIAADETVRYNGEVTETRLSSAGRVLAMLASVIGSPLPKHDGATGAATVTVTGNGTDGTQTWTRTYAVPGRAPQVICSKKRFRGETGLEEYVGGGIGMALDVGSEDGALTFRSRFYFFEVGPVRCRIPRWMSPGDMMIVHREEGDGVFSFRLTLRHPVLGLMLSQLAIFRDG